MRANRIALSFSGASVLFFLTISTDGSSMPSSVLKLNAEDDLGDEVKNTGQ